MPKVILASGSPRRREILEQVGIDFSVILSTKEEVITSLNPVEIVKELSCMKTMDVVEKIKQNQNLLEEKGAEFLVIGADTIVAYEDKIMGKPSDKQKAIDMLSILQGKCHQVYTGVTIYHSKKELFTFCECADVTIYPMSLQQIETYVDTSEPMDKAGAYAIQGRFAMFIKEMKGEYNTVVGFPIARIYQELFKRNIYL